MDGMEMFSGMPPELQIEANKLRRRQQIAEMLGQRSLQAPQQQMAGRFVVPNGIGEGLGRLGSAYFSKQAMDKGDQDMTALAGKYNTGLAGAVQDYMTKRQGTPAGPGVADPESGVYEATPTPGTPANPMGAVISGMTSGYKPVQSLAGMDLQQQIKQQMTPEDLLKLQNFDPKTRVIAAQMLSAGTPFAQVVSILKPEMKPMQHNGDVADVSSGTPVPMGSIGSATVPANWKESLPAGVKEGPIPGQYWVPNSQGGGQDLFQMEFTGGKFTGSKKLDNAPKVSTTVTNNLPANAGPKAGAQEIFKQGADAIAEQGKQARAANDVKAAIGRMQNLDQQGIFSNLTTGPATFVTNLAQGAGITLKPETLAKLGNTESYNAVATEAWQKLVNQFGGNRGVTQQEAEQIKTILPLTKNSPQARSQLYQILNNVADRQIDSFRKSNQAFIGAVRADDPSIWQQHFQDTFAPQSDIAPQPPMGGPKPIGTLKPYNGR